jgi:serine/threonine-protein kinase RsbW
MTTIQPPLSIQLSIPSELGYEKVVRDAVATFAGWLNFDHDRIEDLKTAIAEVCINAIEHGNAMHSSLRVSVACTCQDECLTVEVSDQGVRMFDWCGSSPAIDDKLCGKAPYRGMGMSLVCGLIDDISIDVSPTGQNVFRMMLYRRSVQSSE